MYVKSLRHIESQIYRRRHESIRCRFNRRDGGKWWISCRPNCFDDVGDLVAPMGNLCLDLTYRFSFYCITCGCFWQLWNSDHKHVRAACEDSLKNLQLEYLDLYLIHFPVAIRHTGLWLLQELCCWLWSTSIWLLCVLLFYSSLSYIHWLLYLNAWSRCGKDRQPNRRRWCVRHWCHRFSRNSMAPYGGTSWCRSCAQYWYQVVTCNLYDLTHLNCALGCGLILVNL